MKKKRPNDRVPCFDALAGKPNQPSCMCHKSQLVNSTKKKIKKILTMSGDDGSSL